MQILGKLVVGGLCVYLGYCGLLFLIQRQMIFPRGLVGEPLGPPKTSVNFEEIWIETERSKVESWYFPPDPGHRSGPAPVILFAHGNAELIDDQPGDMTPFNRLGMGVLLVEYPGYGRSRGTPSQASITEVFVAAHDMLAQRKDVDGSRIILMGRSVGGGAVCALAARRPSAALILISSFTSVRSFTRRYLVPGFMVRDPFDNLSIVGAYGGPVLVLHGRQDDTIPYEHGVALSEAAARGRLIAYDCGHGDCPPSREVFLKDVTAFLLKEGVLVD
jgi:uncharacterized protein